MVKRSATSKAYTISYYRGQHRQCIRNVTLLAPSIIWVTKGSKRLFSFHDVVELDNKWLLLVGANETLAFENIPMDEQFFSMQFSFFVQPSESLLEQSARAALDSRHYVLVNKPISETLKILSSLDLELFSDQTQEQWLLVLYQQLAEQGYLHRLFANKSASFCQQVMHYLSENPDDEHSIERASDYFSMSRATLIRRLKLEHTRFRDVLVNVRMNHAIKLMQQGVDNQLELSLACGYQSQERFSQRFTQLFGLSPKQYLQTL